jgi:prepilin-type N-terminal cleavage/methylation domain-containing protein/prepilin-type processing-associated H-X9-DG protein
MISFHPSPILSRRRPAGAFTLIELLVVISIIALLAVIAIPIMGSVREQGKTVQCRNNLAGIAKAVQLMMSQSDDEVFQGVTEVWPKRLNEQASVDYRIMRSPFDDRPERSIAPYPVSYGINERLFTIKRAEWEERASALILAAPEIANPTGEIKFPPGNTSAVDVKLNRPSGSIGGTHSGRRKICVAFADGHAEDMQFARFTDYSTDEGKRRWDGK